MTNPKFNPRPDLLAKAMAYEWSSNQIQMIVIPVEFANELLLYAQFRDILSNQEIDANVNTISEASLHNEALIDEVLVKTNLPNQQEELIKNSALNKVETYYSSCCLYQEEYVIHRAKVFDNYKVWCLEQKLYPKSENKFYKEFEAYCSTLGIFRVSKNRYSAYQNLNLLINK
jgi:hypothetical protein